MTLNGHFTLIFIITNSASEITLHTYRRASGDVRKRTVIRRINIRTAELRIFRRRYIVGTLTNKTNIII